jgi:hypothetical protein
VKRCINADLGAVDAIPSNMEDLEAVAIATARRKVRQISKVAANGNESNGSDSTFKPSNRAVKRLKTNKPFLAGSSPKKANDKTVHETQSFHDNLIIFNLWKD